MPVLKWRAFWQIFQKIKGLTFTFTFKNDFKTQYAMSSLMTTVIRLSVIQGNTTLEGCIHHKSDSLKYGGVSATGIWESKCYVERVLMGQEECHSLVISTVVTSEKLLFPTKTCEFSMAHLKSHLLGDQ